MNYLTSLLPCEILLLQNYKEAQLKELIKLTFMDLLLKGVLETETSTTEKRGKVKTETYVVAGKGFNYYAASEPELVVLSPYKKSKNIRILLRHLVQMSFQNAGNQGMMKRMIASSANCQTYFTSTFFQRLFGNSSLTTQGIDALNGINSEIERLKRRLPELIASNSPEVATILKKINGNVFLIKGLNLEELRKMDPELLKEINKDLHNSNDSGCTFYMHSYDTYGSTFDSGCNSSGCNSSCSSGCSSCGSGCGGGCGS